jgi:hypothetical protein
MPGHPKESTSARYRRLAGECWEIAHTFPAGRRTVLLQMAQVWQRLSEEQKTAAQQQQQVQPKDDDDMG